MHGLLYYFGVFSKPRFETEHCPALACKRLRLRWSLNNASEMTGSNVPPWDGIHFFSVVDYTVFQAACYALSPRGGGGGRTLSPGFSILERVSLPSVEARYARSDRRYSLSIVGAAVPRVVIFILRGGNGATAPGNEATVPDVTQGTSSYRTLQVAAQLTHPACALMMPICAIGTIHAIQRTQQTQTTQVPLSSSLE